MNKEENSLENAINHHRSPGSVEDQITLSQKQWTSMQGGARNIGCGASGSADFMEAEKRKIITSAVRGADSIQDLLDAKRLERSLDRESPEERGYIDCFGDVYKRLQGEKDADLALGRFHGEIGGAIGHELRDGDGSIGRQLADGAGVRGFADGANARDLADGAGASVRDLADIAGGIAGHEIRVPDGGFYLPPADYGDKPTGIVPANNPYYSGESRPR